MKRILVVSIASVALVLGVAACGDDDDSSPNGAAQTTESTATDRAADTAADGGGDGGDSGAAAADDDQPYEPAETGDRYEPVDPAKRKIRGDGSIQRFGEAADEDDALAVAAATVGFYDARAASDWARACGLVASSLRDQFAQLAQNAPKLKGKDCPEILAAFTQGASRPALRQEARATRVTEVRVDGDRAFAVVRGGPVGHGAMSLVREGDRWKVSLLAAGPL